MIRTHKQLESLTECEWPQAGVKPRQLALFKLMQRQCILAVELIAHFFPGILKFVESSSWHRHWSLRVGC